MEVKELTNLIKEKLKTVSSIKNIINKSDKVYRFKLHGGEVLLHPELADIIEYVKE